MNTPSEPPHHKKPMFSRVEILSGIALIAIFSFLLIYIFNPSLIDIHYFKGFWGKVLTGLVCIAFSIYALAKAINQAESKASRFAHTVRIPILITAAGFCFYLAYLDA